MFVCVRARSLRFDMLTSKVLNAILHGRREQSEETHCVSISLGSSKRPLEESDICAKMGMKRGILRRQPLYACLKGDGWGLAGEGS